MLLSLYPPYLSIVLALPVCSSDVLTTRHLDTWNLHLSTLQQSGEDVRSSLTLKSGVEKVSIAFIYFYRKDRFCCQEYTGKWFRGLKPKCPAHPLYSHQECHRLRTDMIPPLSCAVQSVFKNAALATSGLLPCDYFKPVFDSLCGLWFLPLLMWGFPHRYNASFINISQHLWIH